MGNSILILIFENETVKGNVSLLTLWSNGSKEFKPDFVFSVSPLWDGDGDTYALSITRCVLSPEPNAMSTARSTEEVVKSREY